MRRILIGFILLLLLLQTARGQMTIADIPLPDSTWQRVAVQEGAFGAWIRRLPLKQMPAAVKDHRGRNHRAAGDTTVAAVIDMDIGGRKLEQCMDILMRLYAEYRWDENRTGGLSFPLPGGYRLDWAQWRSGYRPVFRGINVTMEKGSRPDSSKENFDLYLRSIYAETHTQQFYYGHPVIPSDSIAIGDFFVKKGNPSHAVMVCDLAVNAEGSLIALIGHGDTPACEFHLMARQKQQPWIPLDAIDQPLPLPIRRKMTWDGLRRFPDRAISPSGVN